AAVLLQPAARLALLGARHRAPPLADAGGPAARVALVGGGDRAVSAPDEHAGDRHGRARPGRARGQRVPRLRPPGARHQPGAGRARGAPERDLRPPARELGAGARDARARTLGRAAAGRGAGRSALVSPRPAILRTALAACRHAHASRAELRAFQDRALRRLVLHAYERVPFYRALFDRHGLHPRHIRGVEDLGLLPFTSKEEMRGRGERERVAAGLDPAGLLQVRTSGSSGEPFTIRRTWAEDKVQYLLRLRACHVMGIRPRDRVAVVGLAGRPASGDRKWIGRAARTLGFLRKQTVDGLQDPAIVLRLLARL